MKLRMERRVPGFRADYRNRSFVAWYAQRKKRRGPIWRDLAGLWEMEEPSGPRYDKSGNYHHLTDNNTVTRVLYKGAAYFKNDLTQVLSCADNPFIDTSGGSFFVYARVQMVNKSSGTIVAKFGDVGNREFELFYDSGNDRISFRVTADGAALTTLRADQFGSPQVGQWLNIVAWWDAGTNQIGIRINDIAQNTVAHIGGSYDATSALTVGRRENVSSAFDGYIDTVALFIGSAPTVLEFGMLNGAIEYGELSAGLKTNLIAWYDLDEVIGTRYDSHAVHHLLDAGSTPVGVYAPNGYAAEFVNANSEYLNCLSTELLQLGDRDWSAIMWVWLASNSGTREAVSKYNSSGNQIEFSVMYDGGTNLYQFRFSHDGNTITSRTAASFGAPSLKQWQFIHIFHDATNNLAGIQVNDGTINTVAHTTGIYAGSADFTIGRRHGSSTGTGWDGRIGQAALFNRLLGSGEATKLYNSGTILRSSAW